VTAGFEVSHVWVDEDLSTGAGAHLWLESDGSWSFVAVLEDGTTNMGSGLESMEVALAAIEVMGE